MNEPLAQRMRPKTLTEVCGQQHLLAPGRVFRRTIESGRIPNMIFYGPSGTGKTTVARIIAETSGMTLHKLNGTSCGTGDIKAVLKDIGTLAGAAEGAGERCGQRLIQKFIDKRGLAGTGGAYDGHELPLIHRQVDAVQGVDGLLSHVVDLVDVFQFNEMAHGISLPSSCPSNWKPGC